MKKILTKRTLILLVIPLLLPTLACAGGRKSEKMKPQWISKTPRPRNPTYTFQVTYVDNASGLEEAQMSSKRELMKKVEHEENVQVEESYDYTSAQQSSGADIATEHSRDVYNMKIKSNGQASNLSYIKWDEYWEETYEYGRHVFKLYTLYAVGRKGVVPQFDDVAFTDRYGIKGMVCSLIPGMGQLYKGSTAKGLCILGGEAILAGGIIFAENQRASYQKKMYENPNHMKEYNTNMDNWETTRNVCIGAAAALYVYNLVDALIAGGKKRTIVRQRHYFSLQPVADKDCNGIAFSFNF